MDCVCKLLNCEVAFYAYSDLTLLLGRDAGHPVSKILESGFDDKYSYVGLAA